MCKFLHLEIWPLSHKYFRRSSVLRHHLIGTEGATDRRS
jgi:hypothetical protein